MKPFMTLTVTPDEKLSADSTKVTIELPTGGNLPNLLFNLGLVSEVNGYATFKALVVEQTGFEGQALVGTRINFADIIDWEEFALAFVNSSDARLLTIEAYMRFMGIGPYEFLDNNCDNQLDEIYFIPLDDKSNLRTCLTDYLKEHWKLNAIPRNDFLNWDAILESVLNSGYGITYKGHYVFLKPKHIAYVKPISRVLREIISEYLIDHGSAVPNSLISALGDLTFQDLLDRLQNGKPLPPAFLDNELRKDAFEDLAKLISNTNTKLAVEHYEKIWVKPVKEE